MLDPGILQQEFQRIITRYPEVSPILRRLAQRLVKSGTLSGRMKLADRLSVEKLEVLCTLFPNSALDQRPDGTVILRLDRLGIASEESEPWISALCTLMDVPRTNPADRSQQADRAAALALDRCRLRYPELMAVWNLLNPSSIPNQSELFLLADAVSYLITDHDPLGPADLGARFFGNSKALKQSPSLARCLEEWLLILNEDEVTDEARRRVWLDHGVVENPTAIKVTLFGPLVYWKNGERFDWIKHLYVCGETATLSWDNLHNIDILELPVGSEVTTCENETPFTTLVRERFPGLILYTAGYPNSAVRRIIELLPDSIRAVKHWGDSDLDGLRIAAQLHQIRSLELWRCDLPELQRHQEQLLPLSPEKQSRAQQYLADHPEFPFIEELSYTIQNGWLEQESWESR